MRIVGRLFRGKNVHERRTEQIHPIGLGDVTIERCRIELRENEDPPDVGMQAVADRNVDQPVLAADWDRRLGTVFGEWKEARPLTASEDQRKDVTHIASLSYQLSALSRQRAFSFHQLTAAES
jgi:hypothetical protein